MNILEKLDQVANSDEGMQEHLIHELAQAPFETLPVMIEILNTHPKRLWSTAAEVVRAIGYPANTTALGTLLDHVGDGNSPGREKAIAALVEMDMAVVGAAVIEFLLDRRQYTQYWRDSAQERGSGRGPHTQYWVDAVQGISSFLSQNAPSQLVVLCGPTVAYLLCQPTLFGDEREIQTGILFSILARLGPSCGIYAMPVLLDLLKDEYMQDEREAIWYLIQACSEEVKAPYQHILHRFGEEMQQEKEIL